MTDSKGSAMPHPGMDEEKILQENSGTIADLRLKATQTVNIVILSAGGFLLLFYSLWRAGSASMELLPIFVFIAAIFFAVDRLAPKCMRLAQWIWMLAVGLIIVISAIILGSGALLYLFILLPVIAVLIMPFAEAIVVSAVLILGVFLADYSNYFSPWPEVSIPVLFAGSLFGLGVGYASMGPLFTAVEWSSYSYRMARDKLEESRSQRVAMLEVEEDLKKANQELTRLATNLKRMTYRAEEARRIKQEFVANVSHELRTPLNMIIGYANLMINSPNAYGKKLPTQLMADINSIQRNSLHLVNLINDVLDLSQVDAHRMALSKSWTSLNQLIYEAASSVQPLFRSKNLYLNTFLPEQDISVYVDATRIREVVLNLLSNAGRYTDEGGVDLSVQIGRDEVEICVRDTGPGISAENMKVIFEPFSQAGSIQKRAGGSGLGLTISREFIQMHRGRMWVESELGRGSSFFLTIPIDGYSSDADDESASPMMRWINPWSVQEQRTRKFSAPSPHYKAKVSIYDDSGLMAKLVDRYLPDVEKTISDQLPEQEDSPPDFVLSGQLLEKSAAVNQLSVPVFSANINSSEELNRRLGIRQYLLKPVTAEQLLEALDQIGKQNLNILLVDDDDELVLLFARVLRNERPHFHLACAASGKECLEILETRSFDVLILDQVLPDLNGLVVLDRIRREQVNLTLPVIMVSATDLSSSPIMATEIRVRFSPGITILEFFKCVQAVRQILLPDPPRFRSKPGGIVPD